MKSFSLEKYLENPSREVVTRDRRKVRIICTDCKSSALPIIAEIQNPKTNTWFIDFFNIDGTTEIDKQKQRDLFFADEKEELTEFEKRLADFLIYNGADELDYNQAIVRAKKKSKALLELAKNELTKDLPPKNDPIFELLEIFGEWLGKNGYSFKFPKSDALKDLPKWKKCVGSTGPFIDYNSKGEEYLYLNDYVIKISELDKLPKEE